MSITLAWLAGGTLQVECEGHVLLVPPSELQEHVHEADKEPATSDGVEALPISSAPYRGRGGFRLITPLSGGVRGAQVFNAGPSSDRYALATDIDTVRNSILAHVESSDSLENHLGFRMGLNAKFPMSDLFDAVESANPTKPFVLDFVPDLKSNRRQ
jgi:hypothetical protein